MDESQTCSTACRVSGLLLNAWYALVSWSPPTWLRSLSMKSTRITPDKTVKLAPYGETLLVPLQPSESSRRHLLFL